MMGKDRAKHPSSYKSPLRRKKSSEKKKKIGSGRVLAARKQTEGGYREMFKSKHDFLWADLPCTFDETTRTEARVVWNYRCILYATA